MNKVNLCPVSICSANSVSLLQFPTKNKSLSSGDELRIGLPFIMGALACVLLCGILTTECLKTYQLPCLQRSQFSLLARAKTQTTHISSFTQRPSVLNSRQQKNLFFFRQSATDTKQILKSVKIFWREKWSVNKPIFSGPVELFSGSGTARGVDGSCH